MISKRTYTFNKYSKAIYSTDNLKRNTKHLNVSQIYHGEVVDNVFMSQQSCIFFDVIIVATINSLPYDVTYPTSSLSKQGLLREECRCANVISPSQHIKEHPRLCACD